MPETPTVRVGQIWQDADPRIPHAALRQGYEERRLLRVVSVHERHASVRTWYERRRGGEWLPVGDPRPSLIRLDRFRPTQTGYRLIQDAPEVPSE